MFTFNFNLTSLNLNGWDTSTVTNMSGTFSSCKKLVNAPVIPNSVTNMSNTFYNCTSLVIAPVIPDSVTNMYETFASCKNTVVYCF